ncbi:MAG: helix-turn-helix domain-containing protein [Magnetococcales bacterium]|nr:helix-turn-helix domain-containing protein [Magnetococcales bacterium]
MPNTLSGRIRIAREQAGFTQKELADRVGISQTAVHKLECGRSRSSRRTVAIAMSCGVDPVWLETGQGERLVGGVVPLGGAEALDGCQDRMAGRLARSRGSGDRDPGVGPTRIPLISWEEALTWGKSLLVPRVDTWIPVFPRVNPLSYSLRVTGDSMEIEFCENDLILVDPTRLPGHNQFVVVGVSGDGQIHTTFKQLVIDGPQRYLKPLNPRYPIIPIDERTVFCGAVVAKFKEY